MPRMNKEILPVGTYLVTTPEGKRTLKEFSKDYLTKVVENTNKMISAGLKIPAPFKHLKEAIPVTEEVSTDAYNNAGYWDSFELKEVKGQVTLLGVVDAHGDTEDTNTNAGKLKHTVKEVSACIRDKWVDGLGREWGPCLLHVASVLHPVVPGQDGYSLMENTYALSVSGLLDTHEDSVSISEISSLLKEVAGIYLPENTEPDRLSSVLKVALLQYKLCNDDEEEDTEVVETQSLFLSLPEGKKMPLSKQQAEELVKLGAVNPKTTKPFVIDDFDVQEEQPDPIKQYALALRSQATEEKKGVLKNRVTNLVTSGRINKEYAETNLSPQIETYELSLGNDMKFVKTPVEAVIEALEQIPVTVKTAPLTGQYNMSVPSGHNVIDPDLGNNDPANAQLTPEQLKDMQNNVLKMW